MCDVAPSRSYHTPSSTHCDSPRHLSGYPPLTGVLCFCLTLLFFSFMRVFSLAIGFCFVKTQSLCFHKDWYGRCKGHRPQSLPNRSRSVSRHLNSVFSCFEVVLAFVYVFQVGSWSPYASQSRSGSRSPSRCNELPEDRQEEHSSADIIEVVVWICSICDLSPTPESRKMRGFQAGLNSNGPALLLLPPGWRCFG